MTSSRQLVHLVQILQLSSSVLRYWILSELHRLIVLLRLNVAEQQCRLGHVASMLCKDSVMKLQRICCGTDFCGMPSPRASLLSAFVIQIRIRADKYCIKHRVEGNQTASAGGLSTTPRCMLVVLTGGYILALALVSSKIFGVQALLSGLTQLSCTTSVRATTVCPPDYFEG